MSDPKQTTDERDRLAARFEPKALPDGSTIQLVSIRPWWGPKAAGMTPEERAKALNDVMDQEGVRTVHFPAGDQKPQDVRDWLKELDRGN